MAFGFLGAVAYRENPWTVVALFIPVAVIYLAFSRLARTNHRLEQTLGDVRSLQGRIVSTSKLASIGAVSLDLTHQIKNPLTILLGRLEELQERMSNGNGAARHLDIAMDAGWRIQELTETFASMGRQKWVELDVCQVLDEALGIASLRNNRRVEIRRDIDEQVGGLRVKGNPMLIREALSNLFSNSMEAIGENGRIDIGVSRADGPSVVARITDDGVGIPGERISQLFEPFHSTKPDGYGLGLFATRHIMEMHEGSVEIESVEGKGTCVTVSLPAAQPLEESLAHNIDSQQSRR